MNSGSHTVAAIYGMIAGALIVFASHAIGVVSFLALNQ